MSGVALMFARGGRACLAASGVLLAIGLAIGLAHGGELSFEQQLEYARRYAQAQHGCALTDGYVCANIAATDFRTAAAQRQLLAGDLFKAWQVAVQDFQQQPKHADKLDLKHYKIGLLETPTHYLVRFQALLLPNLTDGKPDGVMRAWLGPSVNYYVDKVSFDIDSVVWDK